MFIRKPTISIKWTSINVKRLKRAAMKCNHPINQIQMQMQNQVVSEIDYHFKIEKNKLTFSIDSAAPLTVHNEIYDISSDSENDDIFEFYEIDSDSEHSTNECDEFEDSLLEPLVGGGRHERMDTAESNAAVTNRRSAHIASSEWNVTGDRAPPVESKAALAHLIQRPPLPTHFPRYEFEADTTSKPKLLLFSHFWKEIFNLFFIFKLAEFHVRLRIPQIKSIQWASIALPSERTVKF